MPGTISLFPIIVAPSVCQYENTGGSKGLGMIEARLAKQAIKSCMEGGRALGCLGTKSNNMQIFLGRQQRGCISISVSSFISSLQFTSIFCFFTTLLSQFLHSQLVHGFEYYSFRKAYEARCKINECYKVTPYARHQPSSLPCGTCQFGCRGGQGWLEPGLAQ